MAIIAEQQLFRVRQNARNASWWHAVKKLGCVTTGEAKDQRDFRNYE